MKFVLYLDRNRQWRWRLVAANSKTIADSGESYFNKQDCVHAINLVKAAFTAPVYQAA